MTAATEVSTKTTMKVATTVSEIAAEDQTDRVADGEEELNVPQKDLEV